MTGGTELPPAGAAASIPAAPAPDVTRLGAELRESQRRLAGAELAPIVTPRDVGGRPKGRKDSRPRRPASGSRFGNVERPPAAPDAPPAPEPEKAPPGHYKGIAQILTSIPFDAFAQRTGCPLVKLDDGEREALAVAGDEVLREYMPYIEEKTGKAGTLLLLALSIAYMKYQTYVAWLAVQPKPAEATAA